jgi:hypothetical protein
MGLFNGEDACLLEDDVISEENNSGMGVAHEDVGDCGAVDELLNHLSDDWKQESQQKIVGSHGSDVREAGLTLEKQNEETSSAHLAQNIPTATHKMQDGSPLYCEAVPSIIDHIASVSALNKLDAKHNEETSSALIPQNIPSATHSMQDGSHLFCDAVPTVVPAINNSDAKILNVNDQVGNGDGNVNAKLLLNDVKRKGVKRTTSCPPSRNRSLKS